MQTRKYPRTLEQAFGPYQRKSILQPMAEPRDKRDPDTLVTALSILVGVWVVCALTFGWI